MSLCPQSTFLIPVETERVARAAFPKGTLCLHIINALGSIFCDPQFASLFPRRGQPTETPARLALVTLLQFVENLPDRQAADAVRGRIDWKYALALELTDPGFHYSVLSEFRTRLIAGNAELLLLDTLLDRFKELDLIKTSPAHRFHPCNGRRPLPQSAGTRHGDAARRTESTCRDGSRLAPGLYSSGVVSTLRQSSGKLSSAQTGNCPPGLGEGDRSRWREAADGNRCGGAGVLVGADTSGGRIAPAG